MDLLGVDFTSTPTRRKPITVAAGRLAADGVHLSGLHALAGMEDFERLLRRPGPWLGAFDFPFGLPRVFADSLAPGADAAGLCAAVHARCADRMAWRRHIDVWSSPRPPGQRLAHRVTDRSGPGVASTSPLQSRYVPVAFMYFEGMRRLLDAGVHLPGLRAGDPARVAVEGYPARLAHACLGPRVSYKNGGRPDQRRARRRLLRALVDAHWPGVPRLHLGRADATQLATDDGGDWLDATLCLMQAAWASTRADHGVPAGIDPVEGWIVDALDATASA